MRHDADSAGCAGCVGVGGTDGAVTADGFGSTRRVRPAMCAWDSIAASCSALNPATSSAAGADDVEKKPTRKYRPAIPARIPPPRDAHSAPLRQMLVRPSAADSSPTMPVSDCVADE